MISVTTLFISGFFGPQVWKTHFLNLLQHPALGKVGDFLATLDLEQYKLLHELELGQFALFIMFALMLFTQLPISIIRALRACNEKGISKLHAVLNTFPFLAMLYCAFTWASAQSTVLPRHSIAFLLAWGIACGRINVS